MKTLHSIVLGAAAGLLAACAAPPPARDLGRTRATARLGRSAGQGDHARARPRPW